MIRSISNDFVFIHCPRTGGTSLSRSLKILVPDLIYDDINKHITHSELPEVWKNLRSFTIFRPYLEIKKSYYYHIKKWIRESSNNTTCTIWFLDHARRIDSMSFEEYMKSNEPPINTDFYRNGISKVFEYTPFDYDGIAEFCQVDKTKLKSLMDIFKE